MQVRSISMNWKQAQRIENNVDRHTAMRTTHLCHRTVSQTDVRFVTIAETHPFKLLPASKPLYGPNALGHQNNRNTLRVPTSTFKAVGTPYPDDVHESRRRSAPK